MTPHERPHLARALLDVERQLTEERLRREQAEAALSRQMAYGMDVNKARVAALAALDSRDCTYREGGDTRHCRTDRPCLRCQLYAAQRERERAEAERDALRVALIQAGRHAGVVLADNVSSDFLRHVPDEVAGRIAALRRAGEGAC